MSEILNRIDISVYKDRRPILAEVIALLQISFSQRGLLLIEAKSRAVKKDDIHELMITDENEAAPGETVDNVRVLCFFEIKQGGLAVIGDHVLIDGDFIGYLTGWDLTHMPNHMNFLLKRKNLCYPSLRVGSLIEIKAK